MILTGCRELVDDQGRRGFVVAARNQELDTLHAVTYLVRMEDYTTMLHDSLSHACTGQVAGAEAHGKAERPKDPLVHEEAVRQAAVCPRHHPRLSGGEKPFRLGRCCSRSHLFQTPFIPQCKWEIPDDEALEKAERFAANKGGRRHMLEARVRGRALLELK